MKTYLYAAFAFTLISATTLAHALEYKQLISDQSKITFVSKQMGVAVNGEFKKFSGKVAINTNDIAHAQAEVTIDVASIDTGSPQANEEVLGKNWFNVARFPQASFRLTKITALGKDKYQANGKMTIKGKTVDIITPATLTEQAGQAKLSGNFNIKRLDFDLGNGPWADPDTVANDVQVKFQLQLAQKK